MVEFEDGFEHRTNALRALARRLVRDEHDAEDAVQETWTRALASGPADHGGIGRWMETVLRNIVKDGFRGRGRRAARERMAAREEAVPSGTEILERMEVLRNLTTAAAELAEPYRSTLHLRYFEGLSPREIARRTGVPKETVKTRLRRGLDLLRKRLDRESGSRDAWCSVLLPMTKVGAGSLAVASGGLVLSKKWMAITAAVLACAAGGLWISNLERDALTEDGSTVSRGTSLVVEEPAVEAALPSPEDDREALVAETAEEPQVGREAREGVAIFGRVLDPARLPVPGARVALFMSGRETLEAETDAQGRYRLPRIEVADGLAHGATLVATAAGLSGAAYLHVWHADRERECDEILLREALSTTVAVRREGAAVQGADVDLRVGLDKLIVARGRTGADGRVFFECVPSGSQLASARHGDDFARAARRGDEVSDEVLIVELQPTRRVRVEVVDDDTGEPVVEARVALVRQWMPQPSSFNAFENWVPATRELARPARFTDECGFVELEGVPVEPLLVQVHADGYRDGRGSPAEQRLETDAELARFRLRRPPIRQRVRIPIVAGEVGIPADGTPLAIEERPGSSPPVTAMPTEAVVEGGHIVVRDVQAAGWSALAVTPEGDLARLWVPKDEELGQETAFRRPRTITAHVLTPDGRPAVGARVQARNQGNNPLCEPVTTDESGTARITGLYGGLADVYGAAAGDRGWGAILGSLDLDVGDGEVTGRVAEHVSLTVQTLIDGRPRLPRRMWVWTDRGRWGIASEEPHAGTFEVKLEWPEDAQELTLKIGTDDFLEARATFARAHAGGETPLRVELQRAGELLVRFAGEAPPRAELVCLRVADDGSEEQTRHFRLDEPNADDDWFRFEGLSAGDYRVQDRTSGLISELVRVDPAAGATRLVIPELRHLTVEGRIVAPPGTNLRAARVLLSAPNLSPQTESYLQQPGIPANALPVVKEDGSFELKLVADRHVELQAWHPLLVSGPVVRVEDSSVGVTLELTSGPTLEFEVPELDSRKGLRVLLFEEGGDCGTAREYHARLDGHRARVGGFEAGTYTAWIDPGVDWSPALLEGLELGPGTNEIPMPFERGSSVRFRFRLDEGVTAPRIYAFAEKDEDCRRVGRHLNSDGEPEVVLRGLEAGRYRLVFGRIADMDRREQEIEVDGESDLILDVDP